MLKKNILLLALISLAYSQEVLFDEETNTIFYNGQEYRIPSNSTYYFNLMMSLICLLLCGFSAGVGIGFLSIDSLNLELMLMNGT